MFRWLGGTAIGIIGLIIVAKYPDDVWNLVIWFLQLCEHAADSIVGTWRKTHTTGG
jgi:hypothetical protein